MRTWISGLALLAIALPRAALAWGDKGHEIIAAIARDRLTPRAKVWVDGLLAQDSDTLTAPDMLARATWADKWSDSGRRETAPWYFVDQELGAPSLPSACFNFPKPSDPPSAGPPQDCIVDKIDEFARELAAPTTAPAERLLALKYILHFVGDVHQPLHATDHQNRGGNCVPVLLGGQRTTNLHSYWDTGLLAALGTDPATIASALEGEINAGDAKSWMAGTPRDWAQESYVVAQASAYVIQSPAGCQSDQTPLPLSAAYQARALTAAKRQLERAGVRLAWVLNRAAARQTGGT